MSWTCFTTGDGRFLQTVHAVEVPVTAVTGTVVDIEPLRADGSRVAVERVPSGSAINGNDPRDDAEIIAIHTEEVLDASPGQNLDFVVTLDVADQHKRADFSC